MAHLLDTSIITRLANVADPQHVLASNAVLELHQRGENLFITPQVLVEFRNVATRPKALNGLGLSVVEAISKSTTYESSFPLLVETPDIFTAWKAIVDALGIVGKQVHDARLVAVCHTHAVTHLLTFNVAHFVRLASFGPGVTVVDPATV